MMCRELATEDSKSCSPKAVWSNSMQITENIGENSIDEITASVNASDVGVSPKDFKGSLPKVPVKEQIITGTGNTKTSYNYVNMIVECILQSSSKRVLLSDIYKFVQQNYREMIEKGVDWQNGIRHNLSLNDCFFKDGRNPNGKGYFWAIQPKNLKYFLEGDFRRRWSQSRTRRKTSKEIRENKSVMIPSNSIPIPQQSISFPVQGTFAVCEKRGSFYPMYDQSCLGYFQSRPGPYSGLGPYGSYCGVEQFQEFYENRRAHQFMQFQQYSERMPRGPAFSFNGPYNYCVHVPTSEPFSFPTSNDIEGTSQATSESTKRNRSECLGPYLPLDDPLKRRTKDVDCRKHPPEENVKNIIARIVNDKTQSNGKHSSYDMDYILRKL